MKTYINEELLSRAPRSERCEEAGCPGCRRLGHHFPKELGAGGRGTCPNGCFRSVWDAQKQQHVREAADINDLMLNWGVQCARCGSTWVPEWAKPVIAKLEAKLGVSTLAAD